MRPTPEACERSELPSPGAPCSWTQAAFGDLPQRLPLNIRALAASVAGVAIQRSATLPVATNFPLNQHSIAPICSSEIIRRCGWRRPGHLARTPPVPPRRPEPVTGSITAPAA
jgi:hypothetical protein